MCGYMVCDVIFVCILWHCLCGTVHMLDGSTLQMCVVLFQYTVYSIQYIVHRVVASFEAASFETASLEVASVEAASFEAASFEAQ